MTIYEFTEWRFRLGLSREATAELLGVHKDVVASLMPAYIVIKLAQYLH